MESKKLVASKRWASSKVNEILYPSPNLFFKCNELPTHFRVPMDMMIPMRSDKISASSNEWVVRMTHRSFFTSKMRFHRDRLVAGSSPVVGSSSKITSGFPHKAIAMDKRRFIPPDKRPARRE
mmetsp:Transcript_3769/g.5575  ORF Transcript_3769/g.5575 Transcript_3769/m.5575 type:complete len:123 (-) Transcript_3769:2197-2565(-)